MRALLLALALAGTPPDAQDVDILYKDAIEWKARARQSHADFLLCEQERTFTATATLEAIQTTPGPAPTETQGGVSWLVFGIAVVAAALGGIGIATALGGDPVVVVK